MRLFLIPIFFFQYANIFKGYYYVLLFCESQLIMLNIEGGVDL